MGRARNGAVRSCAGCLAWGQTLGRGLCAACYMFARDHEPGVCAGCGRHQPIRKDYCRLCWGQARVLARESGYALHTVYARAVHYLDHVAEHQLFFADMLSTKGAATSPPRKLDRRGAPRKPPQNRRADRTPAGSSRSCSTTCRATTRASTNTPTTETPGLPGETTVLTASARPAAGPAGSASMFSEHW